MFKGHFIFAARMSSFPHIELSGFLYTLPDEKIAAYPLASRDASRLLVYRNGEIDHRRFTELPQLLPENAFLFFNNTRVIPARLHFTRTTGATIEIFLLEPAAPFKEAAMAMQANGKVNYNCLVGNLKKWKEGEVLQQEIIAGGTSVILYATLLQREDPVVEFTWQNDKVSFAELLTAFGKIPLPPYIKREANAGDEERYQTVFAQLNGAVAAPTASLHFSEEVFSELRARNIPYDFLTLHVGAGTFKPVKSDTAAAHDMHHEEVIISLDNIRHLLEHLPGIIAVGTTALRSLESLYWFGVYLVKENRQVFYISKEDPWKYPAAELPEPQLVLQQVMEWMISRGTTTLRGETGIFIVPGYTFRICNGIITNFHQPGSTLILLIAAFTGNDWRKIYTAALENDYRFLSYGDSSLLLR